VGAALGRAALADCYAARRTAARAACPKLSPVARVRNDPHPPPASPAAVPTSSTTRTPATAVKVSAGQRRDSQDGTCRVRGELSSPSPGRELWRPPGTSQERLRRRSAIGCADSGRPVRRAVRAVETARVERFGDMVSGRSRGHGAEPVACPLHARSSGERWGRAVTSGQRSNSR
jgi:hypothetical protein